MSSSQCIVPNWNLRQQRQKQVDEAAGRRCRASGHQADEGNNTTSLSSPSHVHSHHHSLTTPSYVVPMSDYEVAELTWENGQIALHELRGFLPSQKTQTTPATWEKPGDHTLESIVHQATFPIHQNQAKEYDSSPQLPNKSSGTKWGEHSGVQMHVEPNGENSSKAGNMDTMSEGEKWREIFDEPPEGDSGNLRVTGSEPEGFMSSSQAEERASACASASAAFCRDTTMMTWNSMESARSLKSDRNADDDSTYHLSNSENQKGGKVTKGESFRRRSRAAAIHNQSERRRRDRINEKMRALQKLVPNASKTDKASMLDEVIDYLKQLQAQVQMMSTARNMQVPQMVMPAAATLGMQQQLQMSLLAGHMGMGIGMGMGSIPGMGVGMGMGMGMPPSLPPLMASSFMSATPQPFAIPPIIPSSSHHMNASVGNHAAIPNYNDGYQPFFAQQSMNMDFLNKMTALYRQQQSSHVRTIHKPLNPSTQPNNGQPES